MMDINSRRKYCEHGCGKMTNRGICSYCAHGSKRIISRGGNLSIEELRRRELMDGITLNIQEGWFYPDGEYYILKD
tara:strand:- start:906 stop:1133 length:228 start_codon:yes stop_codon:yes gene_type:complete